MPKITVDEFIQMKKRAEASIEQVVSDLYERTGFMVQFVKVEARIGVNRVFVTVDTSGKFFPRS